MKHFSNAQRKLIVLSSLGGILEFYDFIIYALLAGYIAQVFFPVKSHITSLMITFATFSVGYLIRPIGGIILGHYGDKFGRKKIFTLSVFIMATSTFLIGLVPSYQQIGIIAPLILVALRLMQGFSVGGEIPGAITYISESIPERKGYACGLLFFGLIDGIVLGSIVSAILSSVLSNMQILHWGWRIPFLIGGVLGVIGYFLRKSFQESALFQSIENKTVKYPFVDLIKSHPLILLCGIMLVALGACITSLFFLFAPAYLSKLLHYSTHFVLWVNALSLLIASLITILFGFFSDKFNKKSTFIIISIVTIFCAYPIFKMFIGKQISLVIPMLIAALLEGAIWGVIPALLAEMFPTRIRYSGVATAYNLGFAIFAGLTPVIAMALISWTTKLQSPALYLVIVAIAALIAAILLPMKKLFSLTHQ